MSPHRIVRAPGLPEPSGYAHAVVAEPGTLVYLGGHTAQGSDGAIRGRTVVEQFDVAAGNVVAALAAAGGQPEHLVYVAIYVTDVAEYRASLGELGGVYRRHLGHHYPAMALLGVSALFDDAAKIELVGVAVIPGRQVTHRPDLTWLREERPGTMPDVIARPDEGFATAR